MVLTTQTPARVRTDVRDRPWFTALVVGALIVGFGVLVVRVVHRDVVQGWTLLATCSAPAGAVPAAVSTSLDASVCDTDPRTSGDARGWPVVAAVLPGSAGDAPAVTRVRTDSSGRTVTLEYRAGGAPVEGEVVAFVELPPGDVPPTPVTVTGVPVR
ncbi:MAG TPA: hypothetical protein VFL59_15905 [Candidatus Nanopelagicales bacterium]|nr:hypothetical protein [Candidatus Nanopelagicales bacterium]